MEKLDDVPLIMTGPLRREWVLLFTASANFRQGYGSRQGSVICARIEGALDVIKDRFEGQFERTLRLRDHV
jgi:hypothetical protein